jgi:spermidine dehydrogenase
MEMKDQRTDGMTRRQFIDTAGLAVSVLAVASACSPETAADKGAPQVAVDGSYPPMLQGIRGQTDASFAVPHAMRDGQSFPDGETDGGQFDLVVVGAGLSGLAAAYFYRKAQPEARILILDNCDDFGGHARRNEFIVDGRKLIGKGGTYMIMFPGTYTPEGKALLADIGLDKELYYRRSAEDQERLADSGLGAAVFFEKEGYGRDALISDYPDFSQKGEGGPDNPVDTKAWEAFLRAAPLSSAARSEIGRIMSDRADHLPGMNVPDKIALLRGISYADYLTKYLGAGPDTLRFLQNQLGSLIFNVGAGPDSFSAMMAYSSHLPGFAGLGLPPSRTSRMAKEEDIGEDIQLPDGNAGIARLLVRWLIPAALPGSTFEDSIGANVDYPALDRPSNAVCIRLQSTVTHVVHDGDPMSSDAVVLSYVKDGKTYKARGSTCVLGCFNAIVPYICPELPDSQKTALKLAVRKPLVWATVALRNWRPLARRRVGIFYAPGSFFHVGMLETSRTLGSNRAVGSPDQPALLYLAIAPNAPGLPQRDQYRAGRAELLGIDRATYEENARTQLERMFGADGFNAQRDIAGITVNRWAHGYAGGLNDLYDPVESGEPVFVRARKRFGRIAIANSDASGVSMTQAAFDQANRAVRELLTDVVRPEFYIKNPERG